MPLRTSNCKVEKNDVRKENQVPERLKRYITTEASTTLGLPFVLSLSQSNPKADPISQTPPSCTPSRTTPPTTPPTRSLFLRLQLKDLVVAIVLHALEKLSLVLAGLALLLLWPLLVADVHAQARRAPRFGLAALAAGELLVKSPFRIACHASVEVHFAHFCC